MPPHDGAVGGVQSVHAAVVRADEDLAKQPWPYPSNVVFMGQGEPLRNYDAVVKALEGFCDVSRFAMQVY